MKTIYEVAKRAHVSVATVSRVINNSGYVSVETRELVEKAIQELGYTPNRLASSFFSKKSYIIGLVVPHFASDYFSELIEILEQEISSRGYQLMVFNTGFENTEKERLIIKTLREYNVDGLVIVQDTEIINEYIKLKTPIISIDRKLHPKIPSISSDNYQGGTLAAKEFLQSNKKKILKILGPTHLSSVLERQKGFDDELSKHNIISETLSTDFRYPHKDNIRNFIQSNKGVDAIFCASDTIAAATINVINSLGLKVPEDISIIGFDNSSLCDFTTPTLSTISQDLIEIGKLSIDMIEKQIKREPLEKRDHLVEVFFIKRDSTN